MIRASLILLLAATLGPAPASAATRPAAGRVDQLMTLLPLSQTQETLLRASDRERLVLENARPDKVDILEPIYARFERCLRERTEVASSRAVRQVLTQQMSVPEIDELIAFYSGPEVKHFAEIGNKAASGEPLTPQEEAAMRDIATRPTIKKFYDAVIASAIAAAGHPQNIPADANCAGERTAAIAALGIAPASTLTGTMP